MQEQEINNKDFTSVIFTLTEEATTESIKDIIAKCERDNLNLIIVEDKCIADSFDRNIFKIARQLECAGHKGILAIVEDIQDKNNTGLNKVLDTVDVTDKKVMIASKSDVIRTTQDRIFHNNTMYLKPTQIDEFKELDQHYHNYGLTKKQINANIVPVRDSKTDPKIGNNEPCPCGSGKKYKKCCKK